jgi:hypothetical protein
MASQKMTASLGGMVGLRAAMRALKITRLFLGTILRTIEEGEKRKSDEQRPLKLLQVGVIAFHRKASCRLLLRTRTKRQ